MKCVICKNGETQAGHTTVTLHRDGTIIVTKGVPAEICGNCGEYYLDEKVTELLLARAEHAAKGKTEIEVLQFAA